MKKIFLSCFVLLLSISTFSQTDKDQVLLAGNDYVDAFYFGDSVKLFRSISPAVIKYGYYRPKDSTNYAGEPMTWKDMINYVRSVAKRTNKKEHPRKVEVLDLLDKTAVVKVTAWWGNDYLLLAKRDNKWMIDYVLWQSPPKA